MIFMDNRRTKKIINPGIQGRILVLVLAAIILTVAMMGGFVWFCVQTIENLAQSHPYMDYATISENIRYFSVMSFLGILTLAIFLILLTVRLTHRMAGPIFRIKKEMDQMRSSGKINIIYIRSDDFHQDVVRSINQFLLYCRKKNRDRKSLAESEVETEEEA